MSSSCSSNVFEIGKYPTQIKNIESATSSRTINKSSSYSELPQKPLLIAMPVEAGEYPVVILLHGYLLDNQFYSMLIQHVASHGFIVVAPQLYTVAGSDSTEEIKSAATLTNWLSEGLSNFLPPHVRPNLTKLVLSGHSRGGKTAFALALDKASTSLKFSAVIGIDPVGGTDKGKQTTPHVLTYVPHSFDLDMPAMVIGSGLGELKRIPFFPPCAPKGVNHENFFEECKKPACYFVVKDYGHLDMLDDDAKGILVNASYFLCVNGKSREPMRRFIGGVMVAFMKAYLDGDYSDLYGIRDGETGPVELQASQFYV